MINDNPFLPTTMIEAYTVLLPMTMVIGTVSPAACRNSRPKVKYINCYPLVRHPFSPTPNPPSPSLFPKIQCAGHLVMGILQPRYDLLLIGVSFTLTCIGQISISAQRTTSFLSPRDTEWTSVQPPDDSTGCRYPTILHSTDEDATDGCTTMMHRDATRFCKTSITRLMHHDNTQGYRTVHRTIPTEIRGNPG